MFPCASRKKMFNWSTFWWQCLKIVKAEIEEHLVSVWKTDSVDNCHHF